MSISAQKNHPEPRSVRSVSIDEAAGILGVSRRTVYNRIRDGRLQTRRTFGGSQRPWHRIQRANAGRTACCTKSMTLRGGKFPNLPIPSEQC